MTTPSPQPIPDLQPFLIDPIILGRINRRGIKPWTVTTLAIVLSIIAVSWAAAIVGLFARPADRSSPWSDLLSFLFRHTEGPISPSMPYLRDYPSIVLSVTIVASVILLYSLFYSASVMHSELEDSGCIRYTEAGRVELDVAVAAINRRFAQLGKFAPLALAASFAFMLVVNLQLQRRLFTFLEPDGLYQKWWASLNPIRPGGVVWVLFGAIGIYMVYCESILGLTYVRFLRQCRQSYQFRANMLNPDGLYGWSTLRRIVSNLEVGVLCTLLSSWAVSFFLQPSIGSIAAAIIIATFAGIVMYVFVQVTANFRRQVREDKNSQRMEIGREIQVNLTDRGVPALLRTLVAYQRLDLVSKIPATPIRQRWLVAGVLSIIGPLSAIVVQVVKYFTNP